MKKIREPKVTEPFNFVDRVICTGLGAIVIMWALAIAYLIKYWPIG